MLALRLSNESAEAVGVAVGRVAGDHTVADVDVAIEAGVTSAPSWFQLLLQVTLPDHHPATWGVDLHRGLYV